MFQSGAADYQVRRRGGGSRSDIVPQKTDLRTPGKMFLADLEIFRLPVQTGIDHLKFFEIIISIARAASDIQEANSGAQMRPEHG